MTIDELRREKERYGFTCKMISEISGVPMSTVLKVFSGNNKNPRLDTINKLNEGFSKLRSDYADSLMSAYDNAPYDFHIVAESGRYNTARKDNKHDLNRDNMDLYNARRIAEESKILHSKKQGEFTIDDLKDMPDGIRYEICDGRLIKMEAPTVLHQHLAIEINVQLRSYIIKNKGKCIPYIAPIDVQLDEEGKDVFEPDVFVVCKGERTLKRIYGAPDLIIEITSPSNKKYDMQTKLAKYTEYGVREYWIVDPEQKKVIIHELEKGDVSIYTFDMKIPVGIYEGKLKIDFDAMPDYVKAYYE